MSKGTIIYIGGFELPDKNAAAHRVLSNGKILRELGYNVVFIDVDKELKYSSDVLLTRKEVQKFDRWSRAYPSSNKNWLDYLLSIDVLQKVYKQYDDVVAFICYNFQSVALMKLMYFCRSRNVKVIADCTEWYNTRSDSLAFFIIKGLDTFCRMRVLHKKLDGIIVISSYLEKYYSKCRNIIKLPPLVDLCEEKWKKSEITHINDVVTFVYAGSPWSKDKINLLVEALSKIDEPFKFNVIGMTKEQYLKLNPNHNKIIEHFKGKVNFIGRINHLDALNYVKQADFSCFIREENRVNRAGFPTKFSESISCGTPVITNSTSDIEEYITDENQLSLFEDTSQGELIKTFRSVLTEHRMQPSSKEWDQFDYRKYIDIMSQII